MVKLKILTASAIMVFLAASCSNEKKMKITYPQTMTVEQKDTYFGTEVSDPYRWLEDDNSDDTKAWVIEQNNVTNAYLEQLPIRVDIKNRLTELWNFPKEGAPYKRGNHWFYSRNEGLQNQSVVYVKDSEIGVPRVLIDPNKFSEDGTVSLAGTSVSKDGKYMAYLTSDGGSDWNNAYVIDVATGEKLKDELHWLKSTGLSWYKDGFFYSRYDAPKEGGALSNKNEFQKVYYHKLGTPQSSDELIFVDKHNPLRNCSAGVSDDERFLFISQSESTDGNILYIKNLEKNGKLIQINDNFESDFDVVDVIDNKFIIHTNYNAPNYQIISLDADNPVLAHAKVFIAENPNELIEGLQYIGGKLFAIYLKDVHHEVRIYNKEGVYETDLKLPALGTFGGLSGSAKDDVAHFTFTSFTFPSMVYRYEVSKNDYTESFKPEINIDLNQFETKQIFYTSKDGTKVPMFIVHKKGLKLDGNNPTLLYGYGGFNVSVMPTFSVSRLVWIENGGIFALANIRGGGEYGQKWHEAGIKMNKQNVFDDFIAAGEYLINEKYTKPAKLAIQGGSNGGLLVGAVVNQRPDLFGAAVPQVGVMDMLRYQKFTIGWAWAGDYGTSDDSKEMFEYLYKYSPLHNIRNDVDYPAVMVMTADHDDRVVPAHSFKYTAQLQVQQKDRKNPMLIHIQTRAGHGAGKPTSIVIDETADMFAFMLNSLDAPYHKVKK